jgi:hypothetical protein
MSQSNLTRKAATETIRFVSGALADGFKITGNPNALTEGWRRYCAARKKRLGRISFRGRVDRANELYNIKPSIKSGRKLRQPYRAKQEKRGADQIADQVLYWLRKPNKLGPKTVAELSARTRASVHEIRAAIKLLEQRGVNVTQIGDRFDILSRPPQSYTEGAALEIESRPDGSYVFAAIGDLHAASKHTRWDVREHLIREAEKANAQAIFDTGNWIDGEANFNRYDLEVIGLEQQCQMLARRHPKTSLPIYAVSGDDHEGWYAQREGIDVGKYCANIMRAAGHDWNDLGYQEAHVTLRHAGSGKTASLAVVHPGGGSAYALSYSIQKIVESYEGGEKPHAAFYGHYHKLWAGIIRNIWVVQTGCAQDQTSFMRKKRLEAHVGGAIVQFKQDPRTGALLEMTTRLIRYFNTGFERGTGRWSHHGPVRQPKRSIGAIRA